LYFLAVEQSKAPELMSAASHGFLIKNSLALTSTLSCEQNP
jgi:hypothetical protein